jgi:hypothetical protein
MVEAGLRGVSGLWLTTVWPESVSTMTKLTALDGSRCAAMTSSTGAGGAVLAHAPAAAKPIDAHATCRNTFN